MSDFFDSSFENLRDFVGAEDLDTIASCVMSFGSTEIGRKIADACIHDLKNNFRGDVWRNNGPDVITRILHKICQADNVIFKILLLIKYNNNYFFLIDCKYDR